MTLRRARGNRRGPLESAGPNSNAGPVVGSLRFLGFAAKRSSITSLRLLVSRKLDSQSFAQVDEGGQARNSLLKPFGSLPNALSFSNSLRKLRLALRRMPAHSLLLTSRMWRILNTLFPAV